MVRFFLSYALPLVVPTVIYFLWQAYLKRRASKAGSEAGGSAGRAVPWIWLVAAGFGLLVVTLGALVMFDGYPPGGVYQAPHLKDGKIVPGRVVPDGPKTGP